MFSERRKANMRIGGFERHELLDSAHFGHDSVGFIISYERKAKVSKFTDRRATEYLGIPLG